MNSAAIALGLPVVAGVALIPLRPHLAQSISLIMVVLVAVGIVTGFIADAAQGAVESTRVRHRDLEIPVGRPPQEHGRFLVRTTSAEISVEERYAAASIASTLGRLLDVPTAEGRPRPREGKT